MYYVGVDGGGTKTIFALFQADGTLLDDFTTTTSHFKQIGFDGVGLLLAKGVNHLLQMHGIQANQVRICFGLAGYGQGQQIREQLQASIQQHFPGFSYIIANDAQIALEGALNGQDGIMVIAGTGSIALSTIHGVQSRCGGWGYQIGDEGSGYWIGRKLLSVFSKQADGRLPRMALYHLLMAHAQLNNDFELISYMEQNQSRTEVASLTPIGVQAALQRDTSAIEVFCDAGAELAELVLVLAQKHQEEKILVSYYGGVFQAGELLLEPLRTRLGTRFNLREPQHEPVYGAYLLAKKSEFNMQ